MQSGFTPRAEPPASPAPVGGIVEHLAPAGCSWSGVRVLVDVQLLDERLFT
jgi:hypothetical protein